MAKGKETDMHDECFFFWYDGHGLDNDNNNNNNLE